MVRQSSRARHRPNDGVHSSIVRTCVGCRKRFDREKLIRLTPTDGCLRTDDSRQKRGRGHYLCSRPHCLTRALKNRRLSGLAGLSFDALTTEVIAALTARVVRQLTALWRDHKLVIGYDSMLRRLAEPKSTPTGLLLLSRSLSEQRSRRLQTAAERRAVTVRSYEQRSICKQLPIGRTVAIGILSADTDQLVSALDDIEALLKLTSSTGAR